MKLIGMKIPARSRLFQPGGITAMKDAMSYVLTLPVSTVIVGCDDVKQLEENISIAVNFDPLPKAEMGAARAVHSRLCERSGRALPGACPLLDLKLDRRYG